MSFIRNRPVLTGALSLSALGSMAVYLGKRYLDRSCPRIPITQVPRSSACRNLVESTTDARAPSPWGMENGSLLASWSGGGKDRWIPSFAALQIEIPTSLLAGYRTIPGDGGKDDSYHLMQNLVAAFLDARAKGPEGWLLDDGVPPLSFEPGSHLFGKRTDIVAFMLGTWSSTRGGFVQPLALPPDAPEPISKFPSNKALVQKSPTDAAGAVMYWHLPAGLIETVDKAASYGWPWRLMPGGYQEWIVEKASDEKVRVTYVMVECSRLQPRGQSKRDFKTVPKLGYEAHVLYAQSLLDSAVREMKKAVLMRKSSNIEA